MITDYLVTHPEEPHALAWATIEESPAGGFNTWSAPYGGWTGPGHAYYGQVVAHPYWRPDERSARGAALDMCLEWIDQARADGDGGYVIQVSDGAWVIAELDEHGREVVGYDDRSGYWTAR